MSIGLHPPPGTAIARQATLAQRSAASEMMEQIGCSKRARLRSPPPPQPRPAPPRPGSAHRGPCQPATTGHPGGGLIGDLVRELGAISAQAGQSRPRSGPAAPARARPTARLRSIAPVRGSDATVGPGQVQSGRTARRPTGEPAPLPREVTAVGAFATRKGRRCPQGRG